MLAHLYIAYAKISDGNLEDNNKRMRANYDVNQPMEVLIEQIDGAMYITAVASNPYSVEQVVTAPYNLVFKTGMFSDDLKCGVDTTQPTRPGCISKHISLSRIRNSADCSILPRARDTIPPTTPPWRTSTRISN